MEAKIKIETDGQITKVYINGIEMSRCIRKVEFVHEAGEMAAVMLEFIPDIVTIDSILEIPVKLPKGFAEMVAKRYSTAVKHDTVKG